MPNASVEEEILAILRDTGGVVRDDKGFAARFFYDRCATASNKQVVSGSLTRLDRQGLIVRDMPSAKRCTLIALPEAIKRPAHKSLRVVLSETVEDVVASMETQVQAVIDSEVQAELHKRGTSDEQVANLESECATLRATVESLKIKARPTDELQERISHLENQLNETREQLRIAEHNVEVWKQKAFNKRWKVADVYETVANRLTPQELNNLSKMIAEMPKSR